MKIRNIIEKFAGLLILLIFPLICFAQEMKINNEAEKNQSLQLAIKSNKQAYNMGEEIQLEVIFENKSNNIITIAIGKRLFSDLEIYKDTENLEKGVLYDIKDAPLGFFEEDYQKIEPKSKKTLTMRARIEKFSNRELMGPSISYSGYAIVSENIAFLFTEPGSFLVKLKYEPAFPRSKNEQVNSTYHKMKDVWQGVLISNSITLKIIKR